MRTRLLDDASLADQIICVFGVNIVTNVGESLRAGVSKSEHVCQYIFTNMGESQRAGVSKWKGSRTLSYLLAQAAVLLLYGVCHRVSVHRTPLTQSMRLAGRAGTRTQGESPSATSVTTAGTVGQLT